MGEHQAKGAQTQKPSVRSSTAPAPKQDRPAVYLREPKIAAQLWHAISAHLSKVDLPPATRSVWVDENRFVAATLKYLRPFELFLARDRLSELLFPTRPYDAIANLVPSRDTWQPTIGVALAPLFEEAILGSLRRLGPKWVELAENKPEPEALVDENKSLVAETSLIPAHPMDLAVRRGLTTDGVIDLKAGVLPVAKRKKLRAFRQVKVSWQGGRDRALWNFVRPDPADATAEEVAAALFTNYFWSADGAVYAHRLTKVGGLFGVPEGMARKFEAAREHAPAPGERMKSREVAGAGSKSADELAREDAAKMQVSLPTLRTGLADSITRLRFIEKTLGPWKLDQTVAVGLAWATGKQQSSDAKLKSLAGVIVEQYELLGVIVDAVKPFESRELSAAERRVVREPLALYARAAASSHLAATCRGLIAAADRKQTELVLSALRATTLDLSSATASGDPTGNAQDLAARSRRLQTQLLQTGSADPGEVESTILSSQEAALEARLVGLQDQAAQMAALAKEVESDWTLVHVRFFEMKSVAHQLEDHVRSVRGIWNLETLTLRGDIDPREMIARRRAALTKAQAEFDKLRKHEDVVDLLQNGIGVMRDHALYTKWIKIAVSVGVMIALSLAANAAGARLGSAIAGRIVTAEVISGAGLLARSGRWLATGIEATTGPAAEIAATSVGQVAIDGGSLKAALLENTLQTLASGLILRRIGGNLEVAKQVERQTAKLWSARNRAGAAILDAGVTVSAHVVINIATAYVARQITQRVLPVHGAHGADSNALEEVFMQGASVALGRLAHGRLETNKELAAVSSSTRPTSIRGSARSACTTRTDGPRMRRATPMRFMSRARPTWRRSDATTTTLPWWRS